MISRYTPADCQEFFDARLVRWMNIELDVLGKQAELGIVPPPPSIVVPTYQLKVETRQNEKRVGHDVFAFVLALTDLLTMNDPSYEWGRYLHLGLASSDIVDTNNALEMSWASYAVNNRLDVLREAMSEWEHRWLSGEPVWAYTHGKRAVPIERSTRVSKWQDTLLLCAHLVSHPKWGFGKLSGPVGEYSPWMTRQMETEILDGFGLKNAPTTQHVHRNVYSLWADAMLTVSNTLAKIATDIRLLVMMGQLEETYNHTAQVGSSSMPNKVNPIRCEKVVGLNRLVRGMAGAMNESVVVWLEQDISHSSVERVAIPDITALVLHSLDTLVGVISGLDDTGLVSANEPNQFVESNRRVLDGIETRRSVWMG